MIDMDECQVGSSSNSLPPFLSKTYEMVDDSSSNSIVSWSESSQSFIVWNPPEFSRVLLPKFFKHNNFSSFIRQLNTYGFRKINPEQWEFANDDFVRGKPHLLKNIHRRKPIHSHSQSNLHGQVNPNPLTETEREKYKDDIQQLKHEKELILSESQSQMLEEQEFESQVQELKERLQQMEHRQTHLVSYFAETLQKPDLTLNIVPLVENHDRKRRACGPDYLQHETGIDENVGTSRTSRRSPNDYFVLDLDIELIERLETSLSFWETVVPENVDQYVQRNSSLELAESTTCAESPTISYTQIDVDISSPRIDMNSEPTVATVVMSNPVSQESNTDAGTGPVVPHRVNDVFWEQFLTENPGSSETQEVQSGRKEREVDDKDNRAIERGKFWWNTRNSNNIAEHLGKLASAGRS